jgi:hypothetical protein
VTDRIEQVLSARLGELQAAAGEPDWAEVQRTARRLTSRRRGLRLGTGFATALVAVLAATPAFGLRGQIVQLFSGGEPAPAPVVKDFSQIDVGAPPGMATGVVAGEARDVLEVPLSTGKTAVVWVAPSRAGGFCVFVSESRHTMGGGGCDRDRRLPFAPGLSIPGPISPQGEIMAPPVLFGGDTLIHGAAKLKVEFEDGGSATAPVEWVSAPIDAGFFVYELPKEHWQAGHRPTALVLEDADGNELARDTQLVRSIARVQQPGELVAPHR